VCDGGGHVLREAVGGLVRVCDSDARVEPVADRDDKIVVAVFEDGVVIVEVGGASVGGVEQAVNGADKTGLGEVGVLAGCQQREQGFYAVAVFLREPRGQRRGPDDV
jgi:hypothetical protein